MDLDIQKAEKLSQSDSFGEIKVRTENLVASSREDRCARLAALKERHRALTEKLTDIVEGKPLMTFGGTFYPTQRDRISAANAIMKWDMALLFCRF